MGLFKKANRLTVLIVEDEVAIRGMLGLFFQNWGLDVLEAGDGENGVRIAEEELPDIIMLDIMLPQMSGFDVITLLQSNPKTKGIPIIICTARRGLEDVERCLDAGADDYIQKPFEPSAMEKKVRVSLEKKGKKFPK